MADVKEILQLDFSHAAGSPGSGSDLADQAVAARDQLESRQGPGNDYLGWLDLPLNIAEAELAAVEAAAQEIQAAEALVIVGIGGSYLGARTVLEALRSPFDQQHQHHQQQQQQNLPVYYAGHQMDAGYHAALYKHLAGKRYAVNVISKSGTTTEPGLAFRSLYGDLSARYAAEDLRKLVFATTDASKGSLRKLADEAGLTSFTIADDVGGRYSVLTPVGLLPIAAGGLDIRRLVAGARTMREYLKGSGKDFANNPALQYAAYRNAQYRAGKKIEIMAAYNEGLHYLGEWWKQLYGESEGKNGKGIFPASVDLSTDLHSMGQWMQDGERSIFETVLDVADVAGPIIEKQPNDADGLNYLAGRELNAVNRTALQATLEAHSDGGVPCLRIELNRLDEFTLGALLYMFQYACGVSAYMLGVNPFDQPGVEAYKKNMFRMLGKPGH
ncbi:MAG: glucose-6-phosphate isomerase [bacterium]|nr:glucose-6-phosphate isomerase [bacterium]